MFDTRLSKRTKRRPSNRRTKEMFYVFDRMFDGLQILSNTTKYDQTAPNTVSKQCLMAFGRQTFIVCPGPNNLVKHSHMQFAQDSSSQGFDQMRISLES